MTTNHPVVVAGLIFILGGILQTACQNRETMLAGRFFAGMGIGFLGVLAPCKSTELSSQAKENANSSVYQSEIGTPTIHYLGGMAH
jgi:predicted MFS family arabinose efflux permease